MVFDLDSRAKQITKISISIVTFNYPIADLIRCLESIIASIKNSQSLTGASNRTPVAVFNNGSDEISKNALLRGFIVSQRASPCEFHIIEGHENLGYGSAQNAAISRVLATSEVHIIMNPDIIVGAGAIAAGLSFLTDNSEVIALSPFCLDERGDQQYLCKRFPSVLDLLLRGFAPRFILRFFEHRLSNYEMREIYLKQDFIGAPIISGCFIMCRSQALRNVVGFDDRYFMYFEDFDLSRRLNLEGKLAYLSTMQIVHRGGNAAKKGFRHILMFSRSAIRFFNDYGWKWF